MFCRSILFISQIILSVYGQHWEPKVNVFIGDADPFPVVNGMKIFWTTPLYSNINSLNISCGLDAATDIISHVNLTCLLDNDHILNFASPGSSGNFQIKDVYGTRNIPCRCSVCNNSEATVGESMFILDLKVSSYVPRSPPLIHYGDLELEDEDELLINLEELKERTVKITAAVTDGYPRVSNISLACGNLEIATFDSYHVYFIIRVSSVWDGTSCTVSAGHVTGLYTMTTSFEFNITYVPTMAPIMHFMNRVIINGTTYTHYSNFSGAYFDCTVPDGNPEVSNITFSVNLTDYSPMVRIKDGPLSKYKHSFAGDGEAQVGCRASHETGLYKKETVFYLKYNNQSSVTKMTANGVTGSLHVRPGSLVTIECEADGNPKPHILLYGLRTGSRTFGGLVRESGRKLRRTFTASLATSDIYACVADNDVDPYYVVERLVEVVVNDTARLKIFAE